MRHQIRYIGVGRAGGGGGCDKWHATVKHSGRSFHLGTFSEREEAAAAHDRAALELFGDEATINFGKGAPRPIAALTTIQEKAYKRALARVNEAWLSSRAPGGTVRKRALARVQSLMLEERSAPGFIGACPPISYIGVWKVERKNRWAVKVQGNGRSFYIGTFNDPEEAAAAHDRAARVLLGDEAPVNFEEGTAPTTQQEETYIQCDHCQQWRLLPASMPATARAAAVAQEEWFCHQHASSALTLCAPGPGRMTGAQWEKEQRKLQGRRNGNTTKIGVRTARTWSDERGANTQWFAATCVAEDCNDGVYRVRYGHVGTHGEHAEEDWTLEGLILAKHLRSIMPTARRPAPMPPRAKQSGTSERATPPQVTSPSQPAADLGDCPICLASILQGAQQELNCGHMFCAACAKSWADESGVGPSTRRASASIACPLCRAQSRFSTPQPTHVRAEAADTVKQDEDEGNACRRQTFGSTFHGIFSSGSRWRASVWHGGKYFHVGSHATREQAARAHDAKAKELKGAGAVLNFPDEEDSDDESDTQDEDEEDAIPNASQGQTRARTFRGISRNGSKWQAIVCHGGNRVHAGIHATREQAARAYDAKAKELKGASAVLNFPDGSSAGAAAVERGQLEGMARPHKAFDGAAAVGRDVSMFFTGYGTYSGVVSSRELVNGRWSYALCFHADSGGAYAARGDMERGDIVTVSEAKLQALLHDSSGGSSDGSSDGLAQGAVGARAMPSHSAQMAALATAAAASIQNLRAKRCAPAEPEAVPARPAQRHKREHAEAPDCLPDV